MSDTAGGGGGSGTTGAAIRAIGQATQVRVVMPTNLITAAPSMIKQIESAGGRTQLTAMPGSAGVAARSVTNASITVARPITQAAYLPRASVTATQMAGVATTATGQRLVTPIRAASASAVAGATVTGLTAGGSFVRATAGTAAAVNRNTAAPATTVISPATSTTWMAANTAGQVQLIRAISHQPRQRIIATQSLGNTSTSGAGSVVPPSVGSSVLSGTVVAAAASTIGGNSNQTTSGQGGLQPVGSAQTTLQSAVSSVGALTSQPQQQQQPTYVATLATVLPPRQHQATLVYSSNVGNATVASAVPPQATQSIAQTQQFSPTLSTTQRFAVATSITSNAPRQLRQIPLAKPISTTKLSTASISIRAPNLPQLTPTIATATGGLATVAGSVAGTITSGNATVTARSAAVTGIAGSTATASVIPGGNLSTTRIIQLQQQPGGTAQQIIGSTGRLAGNVMLQPFIVNTTGGNKIGLRPPVTMAAKGQPSLTITHMGISKLPTTVSSATIAAAAAAAASQPSNLQALSGGGVVSTVATNLSASATPTVAGSIISATPTVSAAATTAAGLLAAQNIVSSGAAGGATVVPLAITTRGGTLTSIKNANGITVGKVVTPAGNVALNDGSSAPSGANIFIQQQQQQRPGSAGLSGVSATSVVSSSSSSSSTTSSIAVTSTGSSSSTVVTSSAAAFLPPGSTIYYESVPASTVHASTGVLSITTATLTASTMSQQQTAIAASLPSTSSTSFSVVPSNSNGAGVGVGVGVGARAISQLQPVVSTTAAMGSHVQAVRFSTPMTVASEATTNAQQQVLMATQQLGGNIGGAQHMVIPLQTSIKVTTASGAAAVAASCTVAPNFLRKRENLGSSDNPIRAAKNLAPTLLSMGAISTATSAAASSPSSSVSSTSSTHNIATSASGSAIAAVAASTATATVAQSLSPAPSTCSSFSTVSSGNIASSTLTVEALSKKDRAHAQSRSRAASPASSDGSTTVSANSSPGVDQQQMAQDESGLHHSTHFNPIHELYPNHHRQQQQQQQQQQQTQQVGQGAINVAVNAPNTPQRMNGGINSEPPRKRARRGTNDSQQSNQSQPSSSSFSMPAPIVGVGDSNADRASVQTDDNLLNNNQTSTNQLKTAGSGAGAANAQPQPTGNKENAKPVEYFLRRPRNCTLLATYKSNWKSANNHFQRYTDVKQREERRPTVIDVANQANIQRKLSGWKIYHLRSLMEDVAENEEASHSHLTEILKSVEQLEKTSDTERLGDLLKGNIQRNKIIVDGMNEAKNQIMKILDHQPHVSEILSRCASKRNFKKRDKV